MEILFYGAAVIGLFTLGIIVLVLGFSRIRGDEVSNRLTSFVAEDQSRREDIREYEVKVRQLSGSILTRVAIPNLRKFARFFGRVTPANAIDRIDNQLMLAGYPGRIGAREFYGIQVLMLFVGAYAGVTFFTRELNTLNMTIGIAAPLIMILLPRLWLMSLVNRRQDKFRRALPDALDMLSVCATAGLGFDQALQRVADYWKSEVGDEFGRTVTEMSMGISRAEALRNLSNRVDIVELSTFVTLIIQSDQLGMSIADTLHAQADQMRLFRRLRAEEEIRKIPVKMLIPIGLFIFPAILAVILGPSVPVLLEFLGNL